MSRLGLLQGALGEEGASQLTPLSFALPEELPQWRAWIRDQEKLERVQQDGRHALQEPQLHRAPSERSPAATQESTGVADQLWMLKTGQDAGKGLRLMQAGEALRLAEDEAYSAAPQGRRKRKLMVQVRAARGLAPQCVIFSHLSLAYCQCCAQLIAH